MHVELISKTFPVYNNAKECLPLDIINSGLVVATAAAKQCYNSGDFNYSDFVLPIIEKNLSPNGKADTYDESVYKLAWKIATTSGHTSILAHASATFLISGVSRALSHQLVRHRIASYTQQSQRYVDLSEASYVVPKTIKDTEDISVYSLYKSGIENSFYIYSELVKKLVQAGYTEQQAREDARDVLPNACTTQLVMTMNYRELGDFLGKRLCTRAQWEIRELAQKIFGIMEASKNDSIIFNRKTGVYKGPKCLNKGYCDEAKSCGISKKLTELTTSPVSDTKQKPVEEKTPSDAGWISRCLGLIRK